MEQNQLFLNLIYRNRQQS